MPAIHNKDLKMAKISLFIFILGSLKYPSNLQIPNHFFLFPFFFSQGLGIPTPGKIIRTSNLPFILVLNVKAAIRWSFISAAL